MSASRIVDGSPPVATARTVMSRSVTMPQGLSCSITTTVPIRRSLIALAASATDASELIATGSLVMTSRTVVVAIEHLQRRDVRYEKNARAARPYPRREAVAASRTLTPARTFLRRGKACSVLDLPRSLPKWGSLASNGRALHCFLAPKAPPAL